MQTFLDEVLEQNVKGLNFQSLDKMQPNEDVLDDWQKARLGKFTASRIGDLMKKGRAKKDIWGLTAENYIYEKISELLTGLPKETPETFAMAWGTKYEAEAIKRYNEIMPIKAIPMGKTFIKFNEICGGSPDGFVGEKGIIEVKCPNSHKHFRTYIKDEIDESYLYQCQGNMLFSNRDWCDFVSFDPRFQNEDLQIKIIRIQRDDEVCDAILERISMATKEVLEIAKKYNLNFKISLT